MSQGHYLNQGKGQNLNQTPNEAWEKSANTARTVISEFGDKSVAGDTFMEILMESINNIAAVNQTQRAFNQIVNFGFGGDDVQGRKPTEATYPGNIAHDIWQGTTSWDQGGPVSMDPGPHNQMLTPNMQRELANRIKTYYDKK